VPIYQAVFWGEVKTGIPCNARNASIYQAVFWGEVKTVARLFKFEP